MISQRWLAKHAKPAFSVQDLDLILYGDSIFESLLGTGMGQPGEQFADSPALWQKHHGDIKSKIMAISGKQWYSRL